MNKVGLAVCYDTKNFGSQLQVLATVKKIEELGFSTEIIRYKKILTPIFVLQTIPRLFNISFVMSKLRNNKRDKEASKYPDILANIKLRNKRFDCFVDHYFKNLSPIFSGWETLVKKCSERYDSFLCGSDQLWLPNNLGSHFYTLEFAPDDKPKISYATSFGVSKIPGFQKKRTAKYLKRFNFLSVREIAGSKIVKDLAGIDAKVVCDPTMLLSGNDWLEVIPEKKVLNEPYILCYFLGTNVNHRKHAKELQKETGYKIVTIPFLDNFVESDISFGDIQLFDVDAADFVNLIRNADYVLTDSFHGTVFSILYQKQFMVFNRFMEGNNSRNSRIDSLCKLLDLEDRRFKTSVIKIKDSIDYTSAFSKLEKLRSDSVNYLECSLYNQAK